MKILCLVSGGLGDELLATPAIRFLKQELRDETIEIRLGGWKERQKLFDMIFQIPTHPLTEITAAPDHNRPSISSDYILQFDIRTRRGVVPEWVQADKAFYCFESDAKHTNTVVVNAEDRLYWHHCFEMAFRFWSEWKGLNFDRSEMIRCRDAFRTLSLPEIPTSESFLSAISASSSPRMRIAVTPGGRNPPYKVWPVERFAEVIRKFLIANRDVFVLGSRKELPLESKLRELLNGTKGFSGKLWYLTGRTKLEELPHIMSQMNLHLTNDTGLAHLGGLLNVPQVVLYLGTDSPHLSLGWNDHPLFSGDPYDISQISIEAVLSAVTKCITP